MGESRRQRQLLGHAAIAPLLDSTGFGPAVVRVFPRPLRAEKSPNWQSNSAESKPAEAVVGVAARRCLDRRRRILPNRHATVRESYVACFSVTIGRCLRPWWKSTTSCSRMPGSPLTLAGGEAHGESFGRRGCGSNRGR